MNPQYINPCIIEFLERERMARQLEQHEAEQATQEHIYNYPDGSVYMGHMRKNDPENIKNGGLSHLRHGRGVLRTPAIVCGIPLKNYTSDEAAENAQFVKWYEYAGTWEDDKMNGYGVNVQKSGNGSEIVIFDGTWKQGQPMRSIHYKSDNDDDDNDNDENDNDDNDDNGCEME
jgi:hypothetical protein